MIELVRGPDGVWRAWAALYKNQVTHPTEYDVLMRGEGKIPAYLVREWVVVAAHKKRKRAEELAQERIKNYD